MKRLLARVAAVLRQPAYRPVEIWVARAALVWVGGKLGFDLLHAVEK